MYVFWIPLFRMILTRYFSWGCTEVGFDAKAMQVCNKIDVLLSTYMLMAALGCPPPWVGGLVTPATELSDAGVSLVEGALEGVSFLKKELLSLSYIFPGLQVLFWILSVIHQGSNILCQTPCWLSILALGELYWGEPERVSYHTVEPLHPKLASLWYGFLFCHIIVWSP